MTIKQAFIGIVTAIALVIAVLISQIVRINTMTGDLQEAQTRIEALETKAAATPKPTATPEPSTEPTATPEPVVYVVSPVSEFNAYNVEAAPYYWLPVPMQRQTGHSKPGRTWSCPAFAESFTTLCCRMARISIFRSRP